MKKSGPPSRTLTERFWEKVFKTEVCWLWTGTKNRAGYGIIQLCGRYGKRHLAHRISYEFANGEFDKSLYVCHHCDNPSCIRPDHLFLGTQTDNMRDCANKGRVDGFRWTSENHPFKGKKRPDVAKYMSRIKAKPFKLISPDGTIFEGINLSQFCRDRGLNSGNMSGVLLGKKRQCKGWTRYVGE